MEFILDFPAKLDLRGDDYLLIRPRISEAEFWEIANEDLDVELIDGVLAIHSPASTEHEDICSYLHKIISFYLEETGKGRLFGSRLVMRLSPKWNPEPDVMVIVPEHYDRIQPTRIEGPADLVIEILSDATRDMDLNKKLPHYLEVGVQEVWIVDPSRQEFQVVWVNTKEMWRLGDEGDQSRPLRSKVLPSLKFHPSWLWNREKFPANEIIKTYILNQK